MQSNNPIFNRSEGFNGQSANAYGNQMYAGNNQSYPGYGQAPQGAGYGQPGYADPSSWSTGTTQDLQADQGRMTVDSVVQKTAITLLVAVAAAIATWFWVGEVTTATQNQLYMALMVGSFGAFALSLVNSFKRVISPVLVLAFAALEGVFLGAFSKFFESQFDGVVTSAILGTFGAFLGTLAAYKFLNIQVGNKFRTFVVAAMFGMVALGLVSMVLGFMGIETGFFGMGGLGFVFAVVGLVLGVFMLILDFDFVENGVRNGLPERESWRAAFAMTVSLVWIYTNLLRIMAILQQD